MENLTPILLGAALLIPLMWLGIRNGIRRGWFQSSSRVDVWSFLKKTFDWIAPLLKKGTMWLVVLWIIGSVISGMSSCSQGVQQCLIDASPSLAETKERDIPVSTGSTQASPQVSKAYVLEWLRTVPTVPSDNGWERVLMSGTHESSLGKYGCELITNCSLLGDCSLVIRPPNRQSDFSGPGRSIYRDKSLFRNQENQDIKWKIRYFSRDQSMSVQEARLLYFCMETKVRDQGQNMPLELFDWELVEKCPRNVVRRAFKRDFHSLELGKEAKLPFAILPFQIPEPGSVDGSSIRTQFDLSVTFTKPLKPTTGTPKPSHEWLEDLPSVIKMVTVNDNKEDECEFFSSGDVTGNNWKISSEEIRERWLNVDEHTSGKIVIVLRQPLTVHVAYRVRGEQ